MPIDEDLPILDAKIKQLRLDYEQYFLGARPREPVMLRAEIQKMIVFYSNQAIQNTAHRFRFSSLCSRFLTLRRQWDATQRKVEEGTYERHVFKAKLHGVPEARPAPAAPGRAQPAASARRHPAAPDVYGAYLDACRSVGQDTAGVTREKLDRVMSQQRRALCSQLGCTDVRFRVVVEGGKAKLKASPVQESRIS